MKSATDAFVSTVVYVSRDNTDAMLGLVPDLVRSLKRDFRSYEVILVHDSPEKFPDTEIKRLNEAGAEHIVLLDLAYHHGIERAMTAGADLSVGDFVIEIDYPILGTIDDLPMDLYTSATENAADIVGLVPGNSKRLGSSLFYRLLRRLGTTSDVLQTEAMRIVSRRVLNRVLKERNSFRFRKISYALSGFRYETISRSDALIPNFTNRRARFSLATDVLTSFSRFGSSVARGLSVAFGVLSILLGAYGITIRLLGMPISEGWTTLMLFLALGFSGVFFILFSLSRTIEISLQEIQNTSPYTVREVVRIDNR